MSQSRVPGREPSTDQVLESVADETRRDVLAVLLERSTSISVRRLATAVAAIRTGTPYDEVAEAERKPIAVALVHVHLPKLSAAGLLSWEPGEAVEPTIDRTYDDAVSDVLCLTIGDGAVADGGATIDGDVAPERGTQIERVE